MHPRRQKGGDGHRDRARTARGTARPGGGLPRRAGREAGERRRHPIERGRATEGVVSGAAALAGDHGLRGYDAVQLAPALTWQESIGEDVVLGTFDDLLWKAGPEAGVRVWPESRSR